MEMAAKRGDSHFAHHFALALDNTISPLPPEQFRHLSLHTAEIIRSYAYWRYLVFIRAACARIFMLPLRAPLMGLQHPIYLLANVVQASRDFIGIVGMIFFVFMCVYVVHRVHV